jgi:hypothetical protein
MAIRSGSQKEREIESQLDSCRWRTGQLKGRHLYPVIGENGKRLSQRSVTTPFEAIDP